MCWCYSLATMMHVSLKLLTTEALESKEIDQSEFDKLMTQLNEENFHKKLRNELAMVVFPIPMNSSPDQKQFDDYADISQNQLNERKINEKETCGKKYQI